MSVVVAVSVGTVSVDTGPVTVPDAAHRAVPWRCSRRRATYPNGMVISR